MCRWSSSLVNCGIISRWNLLVQWCPWPMFAFHRTGRLDVESPKGRTKVYFLLLTLKTIQNAPLSFPPKIQKSQTDSAPYGNAGYMLVRI